MKPKLIIVSGYFNPLHKGHIEYFNTAKSEGDSLLVIVNNDNQRKLKGSKEFMLQEERCLIIKELSSKTSYKVQDNFNFHKARELLKCENTFDLSNIDKNNFKLKKVDEEILINYLRINSDKLKTKYYNEIALKLCKYRMNIRNDENVKLKKQKRIGDFFERKKYFITEEI